MPQRLGPVMLRPPLSGVWHVEQRLNAACPLSALAFCSRLAISSKFRPAAAEVWDDSAAVVVSTGSSYPGLASRLWLIWISMNVADPNIRRSAAITAPAILFNSLVSIESPALCPRQSLLMTRASIGGRL